MGRAEKEKEQGEKVTYVAQGRGQKQEPEPVAKQEQAAEGVGGDGTDGAVSGGAVAVYAPARPARTARKAAKAALVVLGWLVLLAAVVAASMFLAFWALPRLGIETQGLLNDLAGKFEERFGEMLLGQ